VRLTVIGGSAACPNPGDASSSYLIEQGDFRLVLDTGPGSVPILRQYTKLRDVGAVMISHLHSDHTIDLVPFRYGLRYIPNGRGPRVPLWMPPNGKDFLNRLGSVFAVGPESNEPFFDADFDVAEYDPATSLRVGPFSVTFAPTQHFIDCWAVRFEHGDRSLVYLADTTYLESLIEFAQGADLLICEATVPSQPSEDAKSDGHMTAKDAGVIATQASAKHLVLTHIWVENGLAASAAAARETFDGAITIAESRVQIQV
jgi:ribonuclease BN (tRNA processing enzyme)